MKPSIAITIGDYNGIGPEVSLKCITNTAVQRICTPILVGPANAFLFYSRKFHLPIRFQHYADGSQTPVSRNVVRVLEGSGASAALIHPGRISAGAGRTACAAIEHAVRAWQAGIVEAVVTAPVSKKALHQGGIRFPGQTEMLQHMTSARHVAMMLVSRTMRVGLVTIHIPVSGVAKTLTRRLLRERITVIHDALLQDWAIRKPRIAVLALNPHGGEGGEIGHEDGRIVVPIIRELRTTNMRIEGPFPADSFFGRYRPGTYDAVIAMYHDQGLIPLKMSSFGAAVNVSVGLPIVRTSPDHGTAFDIAGKGVADPRSMIEAVKLAVMILTNRKSGQRRKKA